MSFVKKFTTKKEETGGGGEYSFASAARMYIAQGDFEHLPDVGTNLSSSRYPSMTGAIPTAEGRATSPAPNLEPTPPA